MIEYSKFSKNESVISNSNVCFPIFKPTKGMIYSFFNFTFSKISPSHRKTGRKGSNFKYKHYAVYNLFLSFSSIVFFWADCQWIQIHFLFRNMVSKNIYRHINGISHRSPRSHVFPNNIIGCTMVW